MADRPDVEGFLIALLADYREHDCMDIDGADFGDLCVKYGLMVEQPATAEDAATQWAADFDIREGDPILVDCAWLMELRKSHA